MRLIKIVAVSAIGVLFVNQYVWAGGAVMRRRGGAQQAQQQQMLQQQKKDMQRKMQKQIIQEEKEKGVERYSDEVMNLDDLWEEMAVSSQIWTRLVNPEVKNLVVQTYIDWYRKQGIVISKSPVDYALFLDSMAMKDSPLLDRPFQDVLKVLAIMEYDFDNGMDKDQLARQVLGPQMYQQNRKRLGF